MAMFQNHYGWIETWMTVILTLLKDGFKTTTVGLRQQYASLRDILDEVFQNHYGWIETFACQLRFRFGGRFQNHYGWIETTNRAFSKSFTEQFQNHYGWIETIYTLQTRNAIKPVSKPLRLD